MLLAVRGEAIAARGGAQRLEAQHDEIGGARELEDRERGPGRHEQARDAENRRRPPDGGGRRGADRLKPVFSTD
jgi:hypothetical protein